MVPAVLLGYVYSLKGVSKAQRPQDLQSEGGAEMVSQAQLKQAAPSRKHAGKG